MTHLAVNRKAAFEYDILESYDAGIELMGAEVKSLKLGRGNLAGAFAVIRNGEIFLLNASIPPYQPQNTPPAYDPARARRLLLKRSEIRELIGKTSHAGLTLIPLRLYTKNSRIKLALGLAHKKKKYNKRAAIRERDDRRRVAERLDE